MKIKLRTRRWKEKNKKNHPITSLFVDEYWSSLHSVSSPNHNLSLTFIIFLLPLSLETHCANSSSAQYTKILQLKSPCYHWAFFLFYILLFSSDCISNNNTNLFFYSLFYCSFSFMLGYLSSCPHQKKYTFTRFTLALLRINFRFFLLLPFYEYFFETIYIQWYKRIKINCLCFIVWKERKSEK
jgi:hypothetical protein